MVLSLWALWREFARSFSAIPPLVSLHEALSSPLNPRVGAAPPSDPWVGVGSSAHQQLDLRQDTEVLSPWDLILAESDGSGGKHFVPRASYPHRPLPCLWSQADFH